MKNGDSKRVRKISVLGKTVRHSLDRLEVFPAPAGIGIIELSTEEFTSMCPITKQPDLSSVTVVYQPDKYCIESKSLKLYFWGFRDRGSFCESLSVEIAERVMRDVKPKWVAVTVNQKPRGGITIKASTTREQ